MVTEKKFETRDVLYQELLGDCKNHLISGVSSNGQASMLLSGGSSPGAFYEKFSKEKMPWDKLWFSLSDERWVGADHDESNERLVRNTLLQNEAIDGKFIGLKSDADSAVIGYQKTNDLLQAMPKPFDIVLLGMGTDGHTASLFPGAEGTVEALDLSSNDICLPVTRAEGETPRITMTLKSLLNSRDIKLLIFGDEKWDVYEQAKQKINDTMPVSYILNQDDVPVTIYWART